MTKDLFNINIGYASLKNPIATAPLAGITDSKFASKFSNAGLIVLGGYNLDKRTNEAARKEVARGRNEFVSDDPMNFLEQELTGSRDLTTIAVNVRAASLEPYVQAAHLVKTYGAILEINAHCRQPEMVELGAGEALLRDVPRLCEYIREIKKTGVVLSVKTRANVVNDVELAKAIEKAGADIIHIDAMHPQGVDIGVIKRIRNSTDLFIIGNNSVVDLESAKEMFSHGADMVSVARGVLEGISSHEATVHGPGLHGPGLIDHLVDEISAIQSMTGWYNAPKHICGGGDLRALAFCCLPVKDCALHGALKQAGISAEEFMKLKMDFTRGTPLEPGNGTCFGSMAWCCKITKPCFLRDSALTSTRLSDVDYMKLKKKLSEYIMKKRKK
ncbi:MAG: methanogenesis marker 9 domain-containing protein [Candidatus Methanoperedens sp.]|nr:methanogenesis marker 9 domain-containing protein [Candidatus Methanoperedens sp.]